MKVARRSWHQRSDARPQAQPCTTRMSGWSSSGNFTNLRRVEPQHYTAMIIAPRRPRAVFVSAGPRRWGGRHQLVNGNFGSVKCPRLSHRIDYDADQVTMAIPRGCLGRPDWVRVDLSNVMFGGKTAADFQEIIDNPHSADPAGSLTRRLYLATS